MSCTKLPNYNKQHPCTVFLNRRFNYASVKQQNQYQLLHKFLYPGHTSRRVHKASTTSYNGLMQQVTVPPSKEASCHHQTAARTEGMSGVS